MAQILLICLVLANAFVGPATAGEKVQPMSPSSSPPALGPSNGENLYKAEAPDGRKLGKHRHHEMVQSVVAPGPSPSVAAQGEENNHYSTKEKGSLGQEAPPRPNNEERVGVHEQEIHLEKHHHHSVDKSVAGGGVILGGLATTFLVAVFCYIRATGRHKAAKTAA